MSGCSCASPFCYAGHNTKYLQGGYIRYKQSLKDLYSLSFPSSNRSVINLLFSLSYHKLIGFNFFFNNFIMCRLIFEVDIPSVIIFISYSVFLRVKSLYD